MTDAPSPPSVGGPTQPAPPARVRKRLSRAALVLVIEFLGCGVHGLLFLLAHEGWLQLLGTLDGTGVMLALLSSVTVVVGLSALWPGLPWLGIALVSPAREGERRPAASAVTLQLGRWLSTDGSARSDAFRAALALHTMFAIPTLGVVLALMLGGLVWPALALMLLLSTILTRAVGRQVMRRHPGAALQGAEGGEPPSHGVRRVMTGLALSTAALGVGAALLVGTPAPTRLVGTCTDAGGTRTSLPGALPQTPLLMEASAAAITLSAADGGGPGPIPLATCNALSCSEVPTRALMENREGALVITLCPDEDAAVATPQQLELASRGYRLDDGIARRVLRSPLSAGLALAVLLLSFAYSRWGFGALLRWSMETSTLEALSSSARPARLWALALGGAQLAWLMATWLGP